MTQLALNFLATFSIAFSLCALLIRKFAPSAQKPPSYSDLYHQSIEETSEAAWRSNRQAVLR
jgi:hypothetical protein